VVKCSVYKCGVELSIENKEVFSIRVVNKKFKTKTGRDITTWNGWRFICKEHYDLVESKKLKPNLELIYGPKRNKYRRRSKNTG